MPAEPHHEESCASQALRERNISSAAHIGKCQRRRAGAGSAIGEHRLQSSRSANQTKSITVERDNYLDLLIPYGTYQSEMITLSYNTAPIVAGRGCWGGHMIFQRG